MTEIKFIDGGVTAPKGFKAAGVHCGVRKNKLKKDLALIFAEVPCAAAAVYTRNLVKGAPLTVTRKHLKDGYARAIICNSGNANTCNADGEEKANAMCAMLAKEIGIKEEEVIVASTGVIGLPLNLEPIKEGIPMLVSALGDNSVDANEAIMTTDTIHKEVTVAFEIDGVECKIGGIAKGSGMIHPNMATMLVFVTTDAAITPQMLQKAVSEDVQSSFNMVSVDGDTSTNDMFTVMASGLAGNAQITCEGEAYNTFAKALNAVSTGLCRKIAGDGEGATKLLECKVSGAQTTQIARTVAKSVITSSLLKAAMFGSDANWGRVLCAIGYSGAEVDVTKVDVAFKSKSGEISVCKGGSGVEFSEELAKSILTENEILIAVELNNGEADGTAWGCDLTYEYVKINGDYRT